MRQDLQDNINQLKNEHAASPSKLKYIEAFERALSKPLSPEAERELTDSLLSGLQDWQDNPLHNQEVKVGGYAKLLQDIREYESDTFSASTSGITDNEVILVAEKLIDGWSDNHLDGVSIDSVLYDIREGEGS